jgi:hypothetical protein
MVEWAAFTPQPGEQSRFGQRNSGSPWDRNPLDGGLRSPKTAHRFSTAYHILHDFVSIEDLRKTPIDADGNIWYKQEWDIYYCLFNNVFLDPQKRITWLGYLDFLIKRNASDQVENHISGRFSGYIYTLFGRIPDVSYALEGYTGSDQSKRKSCSGWQSKQLLSEAT